MTAIPPARKRLQADLKKIMMDPPPGVSAELSEDNLFEWDALICGPGDTIFEGGTFRLKIKFPQEYPKEAPQVWFFSRMFHPNVYPSGRICLDILELEEKWSPVYDAAAVLCAIQSMLGDPNPDSPANGESNELFMNDKAEYERRVRVIVEMSEDEMDQAEAGVNLNFEDDEEDSRLDLQRRLNALGLEDGYASD